MSKPLRLTKLQVFQQQSSSVNANLEKQKFTKNKKTLPRVKGLGKTRLSQTRTNTRILSLKY